MKETRTILFHILLPLFLITVYGCSNRNETRLEESVTIDLYKKGKGITLPESTRSYIDLQTAEVIEKEFIITPQARAVVFQAASPSKPGKAAVVLDKSSQSLKPGEPVKIERNGKSVEGVVLSHSGGETIIEFQAIQEGPEVGSEIEVYGIERLKAKSLAVPKNAVQEGIEGPFVYVKNGEFFSRVLVKTGAMDG